MRAVVLWQLMQELNFQQSGQRIEKGVSAKHGRVSGS